MLAHDRTGTGPPLLLLHGLGSCKEVWRPVMPLLARERDVIAVDLPGFGASTSGPRTVNGLADAVAAFAAGLGLDRPHAAGNSLGGGIALALAATARARSACGISPIGFATPREATYARGVLALTRVLSAAAAPAAEMVARAAPAWQMTAHPSRIPAPDLALWIRACAAAPAFWDLWRDGLSWRAPEPACPTTIAWGEHDRLLLFSRQAPRARRRLPRADHVVLHGCGHVPTWDDSDAVAQVVLRASS